MRLRLWLHRKPPVQFPKDVPIERVTLIDQDGHIVGAARLTGGFGMVEIQGIWYTVQREMLVL